MNKFTARLSAKTTEELNLVDFTQVDKGILALRTPNETQLRVIGKKIITFDLKLELHINKNQSVAQVFFTKDFMELCDRNSIEARLTGNNIRNPFEGTHDRISLTIEVTSNKYTKELLIPSDFPLCRLRFITKAYHDLQMNKEADGLSSSPVEIEVFVKDNFKPYSNQQMCSHGVEIVADPKGLLAENYKFYELTSKNIAENYLDEFGNTKPQEVQCLPTDFNVFNK